MPAQPVALGAPVAHAEPGAVLPRAFFERDTVEVARALLGQLLVHRDRGRVRVARVVETEAYVGPHDLACHASKGRTPRTEVMFGPAGHAYVFLVYGMHHCVNVVTGGGSAVLIRAVEPVSGLGPRARTDGPGRLTAALGITLRHNALPLDVPPLYLVAGAPVGSSDVARGPRIGVDYAGVWAKKPLRFWVRSSPYVSG